MKQTNRSYLMEGLVALIFWARTTKGEFSFTSIMNMMRGR